ncbi:MAG: SpoIIE family protein phosphatase [Paracoccaceae bacterium]
MPSNAIHQIMVVDDSRVQRKILGSQLARAGHAVTEAGSAEEALALCETVLPDLVISDWMMPGMSGLELCKTLRSRAGASYIYFILLTSKTESASIALGLEGGADDFLIKPVNGDELRARIAAGERILRMERELTDKNRLLSSTLAELRSLYDAVDRDLIEARKLQQSLVRERHRDFGRAEVNLMLRPFGHVGGDLVGFFPINADRIGIYSIDVSGHGITSALMTARIAGYLSGSFPEQNLALVRAGPDSYDGLPPEELAAQLNRIILSDIGTETYFTLAYADLDLRTGAVAIVQAGHPHPMILRSTGAVDCLGVGGLPIGLIEGAEYERIEATLMPGDRLFLMSDGVTEAENRQGAALGQDGLARIMRQSGGMNGAHALDALACRLAVYTDDEFADDVSGALVDYHGRVPG